MSHVREMLGRLPPLYREGELVSRLLSIPALQLEVLDEDGIEVRRAHGFDSALELDEAAGLAALLGIGPEPWQDLAEYRIWVHTLRDAMLQLGAVTRRALEDFVVRYVRLYQQVAGITAVAALEPWTDAPSARSPAFIENPSLRRFQKIPAVGGIEPLYQFSVEQKGLDTAYADFLLTGLSEGPESVPVIVNLTTAEAVIYLGDVPPGARLWLSAGSDGSLRARLENREVGARLRSVSGVVPGMPWERLQVAQPARAISLARGRNDLWFLPVAHFDALGLDRFLLALADIAQSQGRYDQSRFDQAVFFQDAAVDLRVSWVETQPAGFRIELPGGVLRNRAGRTETALRSRAELELSLALAVTRLKAAGVAASTSLQPLRETQAQADALTGILPLQVGEAGSIGIDRLPDAGGLFGVTGFDQSTFR